jgi:predicted amidohydrolase
MGSGPLKEHHWATLLAARALDTTCYIVAAGECGNKNIGQSQVVDPLGWLLPRRERPAADHGGDYAAAFADAGAITGAAKSPFAPPQLCDVFLNNA